MASYGAHCAPAACARRDVWLRYVLRSADVFTEDILKPGSLSDEALSAVKVLLMAESLYSDV